MAIAVPRLTGFQSQAKLKADLATFNTIDKAVAILVSDGTIKADGNVVATSVAGVITITSTATGGSGATNTTAGVVTAMENILGTGNKFQGPTSLDKVYTWGIVANTGAITKPAFP